MLFTDPAEEAGKDDGNEACGIPLFVLNSDHDRPKVVEEFPDESVVDDETEADDVPLLDA